MEKRIASFKVSSLLTLFLSVFFAFSVTSCGGNDPVEDINLVGTAWKGFVSTKNADGKLVTARVNISFLKEKVVGTLMKIPRLLSVHGRENT